MYKLYYDLNKIMFMLMLLLIMSANPLIATIVLVTFSLMIMLFLKGSYLSMNLYLILIVFVSGVLLMLFYVCIMMSKVYKWKLNFFYIFMILTPNFVMMKYFKFSFMSSFLEMNNKIMSMILLSILLFLLILWLVNKLTLENKNYRQLLFWYNVFRITNFELVSKSKYLVYKH